jgi:hypothetical protein
MLFEVFLDGSGKLHDKRAENVVLAGLVMKADIVGEFSEEWAKAIATNATQCRLPIPEAFHATDAFNRAGEFSNWRPEQVQRLAMELAELAQEYAYKLICAPAKKSEWMKLPERFRKKLKSPNELSFEVCLEGLLTIISPRDFVRIVCDDEEKEAMEMYKLLNRFKLRHGDRREALTAICFANDRLHPPLQAADLYAFVQRRVQDGSGWPDSEQNLLIDIFVKNPTVTQEYRWLESGNGLGSVEAAVPGDT